MNGRRLAVLGCVAAGLIALASVAPEIYTGTFSDTGTFLRVVGVGLALGVWALLVRRIVPHQLTANALVVVPIVVVVGAFVWPYLRPATEVDEAFPPVAVASVDATDAPPATAQPAVVTEPSVTPTTSPPASTESPATTALPEPTTAPPAPATTAPVATVPATTAAPTTTTAPTTTVPPTTTTTVPPGPVELRRAGFQGLTGHRGRGDAVVYDLGDGPRLLRFEDVDIGSGPALNVYVVPGADRRGLGDAIYVAPLTAERGNQNYDVPSGVDLTDGTWTVLVWCETFAVEVANATISA